MCARMCKDLTAGVCVRTYVQRSYYRDLCAHVCVKISLQGFVCARMCKDLTTGVCVRTYV